LVGALIVGVIGVLSGRTGLLLWAGAVAAIALGALAWSAVAWRGVAITARFRPLRVFPGQPLFLVVKVSNAKRLPVPIARIAVWLPAGLRPGEEEEQTSVRGFRRRFTLGPGSEVTFEFPVRTGARGEYWLERIGAELSDVFDLAPVGREVTPEAAVLVLPEPRIAVPVTVRRRLPFGAPAPAARIFEQRERFGGVRPYEPGDPLNRIHWKLTGHTGKLQTKVFEPTRSAEVLFVLDLAAGEPFWDMVYPKIAEQTIGWASFLGREAVDAGWRIGLVTNAHFRRGRGPIRIPPSDARGQEASVFAALARMPNEPTSDLAPVLREYGRRLGRESVALVVAPRPGPALRHEMGMLRRRGISVLHVSPLDRRRTAPV
jgi:uncharacterized protein (DUF58 family)